MGQESVTRGVDLVSRVTQRAVARRVGRAGRFAEMDGDPNGYFRVENCRLRNGFGVGESGLKKLVAEASKTRSPKTVASVVSLGL